MRFLFLIFIIVPILEMLLLFKVAEYIGAWSTLALVLLTAIVGVRILRQQGFSTLTRANQRMSSGELPAQEMVEGLFLAVGGAFLLTPGFITDTLGFLFLIGPSRRMLVKKLLRSGAISMFGMSKTQAYHYKQHQGHGGDGSDTFEGEFEREKPESSRLEDRDKP